MTSSTSARASASSPSAVGGPRERGRLGDVGRPRTPAAARDEPLHPRRSARPRLGSAPPPARSVAIAAGSSRSGSGVMESHAWRAPDGPTGPWYHATDHKVRIPLMATTESRFSARPAALPARALPRPRGRSSSSSERIFARTWQFAAHVSQLPEPGSYLTATAGRQPVLRAARPRRRAARLPQRLPPPRLAPAERLGRVRQGDPLPLPRLDLPPRRRADRRARGALDPRPRQVDARAVPGARGDARAASCSSTSTSTPTPLAEQVAGPAGAARALRHRGPRAAPAARRHASRPTGRSSSTTTSRATTCRSPIPG